MVNFYLVGIIYLFFCQVIGNTYTRSAKLKTSLFINFLMGHLCILGVSAIYFSYGYSIAWGLIAMLFYIHKISKRTQFESIDKQTNIYQVKEIISILILFTLTFLSKYLVHYNPENGLINIPFRDFIFYMKNGEYFYLTGIENKMTSKNILFPEIQFRELYRFQDTWLMPIFLMFTPFDTIDIYYLIMYPINFFLVSYAIYWILRKYIKGHWLTSITLSFLFLFFLTSNIPYFNKIYQNGVTDYFKLWPFFLIMPPCLQLVREDKIELAFCLMLCIFFIVPISYFIPISIFILVLLRKYFFIPITTLIVFFTLGVCFVFYFFYIDATQKKFFDLLTSDNHISLENLKNKIHLAFYWGLLLNYLAPPLLLVGCMLLIKKNRLVLFENFRLLVFILVLLTVGYLLYATTAILGLHDAHQMFSNIASPLTVTSTFLILVLLILKTNNNLLKNLSLVLFIGYLIIELRYTMTHSLHHARFDKSSLYSSEFILRVRNYLNTNKVNPIGVYYPEKGNGGIAEQFDSGQHYEILILMGRYFDAVNLKGDSILFDENRYKEIDFLSKRMAINIYNQQKKDTSDLVRIHYLKDKNVDFIITALSLSQLPKSIAELIKLDIEDKKSGAHFYILKKAL